MNLYFSMDTLTLILFWITPIILMELYSIIVNLKTANTIGELLTPLRTVEEPERGMLLLIYMAPMLNWFITGIAIVLSISYGIKLCVINSKLYKWLLRKVWNRRIR